MSHDGKRTGGEDRERHDDPRPATPAPGRVTLTSRLAPRAAAAPPPRAPSLQRQAARSPAGSADVGWRALFEVLAPGAEPGSRVQLAADGARALDDDATRAIASRGVTGPGGALPHAATLRAGFGRHADALDGVRAHVGGDAARAAGAIGATAYATGRDVAFASAPDLHLAAHEAAHVVQQRAGVSLSSGVGAAGDAYEQHADRVADAVVRGESAEAILDEHAGGGANGVDGALQRKHATARHGGAGAAELDAAIRGLSDALDAAGYGLAMIATGVLPDLRGVSDAATALGVALASAPGAPPKGVVRRLEEVGERLHGVASAVGGDVHEELDAALHEIVVRAGTLGIHLHAPAQLGSVAHATADDHERLVIVDVRLIEERLAIADSEKGDGDERARIQGHAQAILPLLRDALRHVRAIPDGGSRTRDELRDAVARLQGAVDSLFAWGHKADADLRATGLEAVFDVSDQLELEITNKSSHRAAAYYAQTDVPLTGGKETVQHGELVDRALDFYGNASTIGSFLAMAQVERLIVEPPAPKKPDLLETLVKTALQGVVAAIPGRLGAIVETLGGLMTHGGEEKGEGESSTPSLTAIVAAFAEKIGDGAVDYVKDKMAEAAEGEPEGHEPASGPRKAAQATPKDVFLDGCSGALLQTMLTFGAELRRYRATLERMPPAQLAQAYEKLVGVGPRLWERLKIDVIAQWLNFKAGLAHEAQEEDPTKLESKDDPRAGWGDDTGILVATLRLGAGGVYVLPVVTWMGIQGIEPGVADELREAAVPIATLSMHRYFDLEGAYDVMTREGPGSGVMPLGRVYVTPAGEIDLAGADWFRLAKIARQGRYDDDSDKISPELDEQSPAIAGLRGSNVPLAPVYNQVASHEEAMAGARKILRGLTATTRELG